MSAIQENLIPIAILSILIFGEDNEKFFNQLQKLGILRFTDIHASPSTSNSLEDSKRSPAKRHLTRAISITAHGKIEVERQYVNGVEKFWVATKTDEPFKIDALEKEIIVLKDKEIRLNFQLRNIQLFDMNNFVIRGTKSMSKDEWAKIMFDLPKAVKLTGRFHIDGVIVGKTVHESGTVEIKLIGCEVGGKVKVGVTDDEINILELNLTYTFENIAIEKFSLLLPGMSKDKIIKLFNDATKKYLRENMDIIAGRLSREIKIRLNQRLKSISGAKIVNNVKNDTSEDTATLLKN